MRLVAYLRLSVDDDRCTGLDAQRWDIERWALLRGHQITGWLSDIGSGADPDALKNRSTALAAVRCGDADGIVSYNLDRLTRDLEDWARLCKQGRAEGWSIFTSNDGIDTSHASGDLSADIRAVVAKDERRRISERTRAALAELKRQGVHVGRPVGIVGRTVVSIVARHRSGQTVSKIARDLTTERVSRPDGKVEPWQPYMVSRVLDRAGVRAIPKGATR